eukprot:COSAG01_NODE_1450_length_10270_cov_8.297218_2_plen_350_part_00
MNGDHLYGLWQGASLQDPAILQRIRQSEYDSQVHKAASCGLQKFLRFLDGDFARQAIELKVKEKAEAEEARQFTGLPHSCHPPIYSVASFMSPRQLAVHPRASDWEDTTELVWASMKSFPWWPGRICPEVVTGLTKKKIFERGHIHIQFFDDPPAFGWVAESRCRDFLEAFDELKSSVATSNRLYQRFDRAVIAAWTQLFPLHIFPHQINLLFDQRNIEHIADRAKEIRFFHFVRENNVKMVDKLLDGGFNVNARSTTQGYTALHWAAERGHVRIIKVLLEHKADITIKTHGGTTAEDIACTHGHHIAETLVMVVSSDSDEEAPAAPPAEEQAAAAAPVAQVATRREYG